MEKLREAAQLGQDGQSSHRFEKYANQLIVLAKLRKLEQETFEQLTRMPLSLDVSIEDTLGYKLAAKREREQAQQEAIKAKKETIRNLYRLNMLTIQQIAEAVNESVAFVRRVIKQQQAGDNSSAAAAQ